MTKDEIIEMARQAGMNIDVLTRCRNIELLEPFVKLVAEQAQEEERSACAGLAYEILNEHESYDFGVANAIRARGKMNKEEIIKLIHAWQAIEETSGILRYHDDAEKRMDISVIRSAWSQMDDLVRDIWEEIGRP
jgi:hypothetical protein